MKLLQLRSENFRGRPNEGLSLTASSGRAARTILAAGGSGAGKTSFLAAIVAAKESIVAYGRAPNLASRAPDNGYPIVLTTAWEIDDAEREEFGGQPTVETTVRTGEGVARQPGALTAILGRYSHDPSQGKVDYFPEHRFLGSQPARPDRERTETEERFLRLTDDPTKYRSVWTYLRRLAVRGAIEQETKLRRDGALFADEAGSGLAPLAAALSKLTNSVTLVGQENESLLFQDRAGRRFGPTGLSASAADALLFAGSLLMVGHQRSVILIDRVDLYRQASDAVKFLRGLRELVGDSQIIATTSSKELAESGVADCVINLDEAR